MFSVSMPNSSTRRLLVETATKCLATAESPSSAVSQRRAAVAFVNVLLVQLGLPVPAYPALLVTGALIARSSDSLAALLAVSVVACLVADVVWYLAGRRYGGRVVRTVCRISLSPDSCVRQTESLFTRWGPASLLIAKFIPGFATIATSLAGSQRLSFVTFVALDDNKRPRPIKKA